MLEVSQTHRNIVMVRLKGVLYEIYHFDSFIKICGSSERHTIIKYVQKMMTDWSTSESIRDDTRMAPTHSVIVIDRTKGVLDNLVTVCWLSMYRALPLLRLTPLALQVGRRGGREISVTEKMECKIRCHRHAGSVRFNFIIFKQLNISV